MITLSATCQANLAPDRRLERQLARAAFEVTSGGTVLWVSAKGAMLKALDRQWLDLTTPLGKGILAFLSALAEDERARILARATGGRAEARKRGVKFGPKPKLAPIKSARP